MINKNVYPNNFFLSNAIFESVYFYNLISSPTDTTNALYVISDVLYFSGLPVVSGIGKLWDLEGGIGPDIYYNTGNVGIGLINPNYPLEITGDAKFNSGLIISNNQNISLQDTIGGLTSSIYRDINDDLIIENTSAGKNVKILTSATKFVGNVSVLGSLNLQESGGTDLLTISTDALGASRTYTIPDAGGTANFIVSTSIPAQGDILYYNGITWVSLSVGIDGYYLKTQGVGNNPKWDFPVIGSLEEVTSSVLNITGGTNSVWGSGITIQVNRATSSIDGYLYHTDFSTFNNKYDGLPSQTGNAGKYLTTDGTTETWATIASTAVAGYLEQAFISQTIITVTHNFGAYPIVQVLDSSNIQISPLEVSHTNTNEFVVTLSGSTTGSIIASVGSPYIQNIISKVADYTLDSSDTVVLGNAEITLTLPTAVDREGKTYTIKNITTSDIVTLEPDGTETIDGDSSFLIPALAAIDVVSDGSNWWVI